MTAISAAQAVQPAAARPTATLGFDAGSAVGGGRRGGGVDVKQLLLFAAAGAAAGMLVPVIPGGPIGGALIGAALSFVI